MNLFSTMQTRETTRFPPPTPASVDDGSVDKHPALLSRLSHTKALVGRS
jgi:hypothetical protein